MAESIDVEFITRLVVENNQLRARIAQLEEVNKMWMRLVELCPQPISTFSTEPKKSTPSEPKKGKRNATAMMENIPSASKKGKGSHM